MSSKVLMKGNEAIAEAAIRCGCRHYFGYPITPQTEIAAYMAKRMPKIGGTFLQAESEIAAINMVYGCASTGRRAMTSSSSPGISLKAEGMSYLAGADLPALIVNVQRGGPGLGGIQPSQSDYFFMTRGPGHGDFHIIVLAPATVQEMADMTRLAFELGEKYRMPAMLLADGTMGQMMEPVVLPGDTVDPETIPATKPWATTGTQMKRPHNIVNSLYLKPDELEKTNFERFERYARLEKEECRWEEYLMDDAEVCVVSVGITARVAKNAIVAGAQGGHQGRHDPSDHPLSVPQGRACEGGREGQELPHGRAEHGPDERGREAGDQLLETGQHVQPRRRNDSERGRSARRDKEGGEVKWQLFSRSPRRSPTPFSTTARDAHTASCTAS